MKSDLENQLAEYGRFHRAEQQRIESTLRPMSEDAYVTDDLALVEQRFGHRRWASARALVAATLIAAALVAWGIVLGSDDPQRALTSDGVEEGDELFGPPVEDLGPPIDASGVVANPSTTPPDVAGAVPGDDGDGPAPLGVVNLLPGEDRLDFLFELCWSDCFRDAHFIDPDDADVGSGVWVADRPFHVRHGFVNRTAQPLGDGFDVVMYITRWSAESPGDDFEIGRTYRFTSDYVIQGTSERCGPTYRTQTEAETCEWFVHDYPEGLPEGRYDLWAFWEAPCSAWIDLRFIDACDDPGEVMSLFSAGVNMPFAPQSEPSFTEVNEVPRPAS